MCWKDTMPNVKKKLHLVYKVIGVLFCRACLVYWRLRDRINTPKEDSILFVAHPDDDTLFFHTFIKNKHPYVVLMCTGWSLRRLPCFFRVMRQYGVRYRAYPTESAVLWSNINSGVLDDQVRECMKIGEFQTCVTHGEDGEYGHLVHSLVYEAVVRNVKCDIWTTVRKDEIQNYPLKDADVAEKKKIFETMYKSEAWVVEQYSVWLENEKLIKIGGDINEGCDI